MAQTLVQLPSVSTPVKLTDANTLSDNVSRIQNLDNRQVLALALLAKIYQLAAAGGTDYRADFEAFRIAATSFMTAFTIPNGPNIDILFRVQTVIDWNAAYLVDNTIGTDVNGLIDKMGQWRITPETTLYQFYLFAKYLLHI